jgi:hypothetical protein
MKRLAVPTHFYKVILCQHSATNYETFAFLTPNQRAVLPGTSLDYVTTVDDVERLSGADLFANFPDEIENSVEAMKAIVGALRVRGVSLFIDPATFKDAGRTQRMLFNSMDVILTGALLGGGAEGPHKLVSVFTNFLDTTATKAKGEAV